MSSRRSRLASAARRRSSASRRRPVQPGDARGFLEQMPPVDGLRADDSADFALAHQRRRARAAGRVGRTSSAHRGRASPARSPRNVEPPPRSMRRATSVSSSPSPAPTSARHTSATSLGGAAVGAGEDDVVHFVAADAAGGVFAHSPAQRVDEVGLAATVGPDDARQPPHRCAVRSGRPNDLKPASLRRARCNAPSAPAVRGGAVSPPPIRRAPATALSSSLSVGGSSSFLPSRTKLGVWSMSYSATASARERNRAFWRSRSHRHSPTRRSLKPPLPPSSASFSQISGQSPRGQPLSRKTFQSSLDRPNPAVAHSRCVEKIRSSQAK